MRCLKFSFMKFYESIYLAKYSSNDNISLISEIFSKYPLKNFFDAIFLGNRIKLNNLR